MHQEKVQQEKLKAVKARLNFEEVSQHSESRTPSRKRLRSRRIRSMSRSPEPRHGRSESLRKKDSERKTVFKRLEKGVFHRLGDKGKSMSTYSDNSRRQSYHSSRRDTESCYQSSRSRGTKIAPEKHRNKRVSSCRTETLSESEGSAGGHWKSRSKKQSHVKTYDRSEDLENHLKIFQAAAKVECWAMPTWCHMFNSTLTGSARVWFDDLPPESVDISRRDDENNYVLPKGEVAAGNQERKKSLPPWKQHEARHKQNFKKGGFKNQHKSERRQDRFTLLSKSPKDILALEKGKFKTPPPMTTLIEKRNNNKFCEFHREVGHNTDECMHLKRQIEELLKAGKLSHVIKELKQNGGKDQPKTNKKGKASNKDKAIENRFGGNTATKKTQKNLLKQQYENFAASSTEVIEQTYERLQKLISQLEMHGEVIPQEDINQKFLRSFPRWSVSTATREDTLQGSAGHPGIKTARTGNLSEGLDQAEEGPTNFALMAYSSTSSSSSTNSEVSNDSNCCSSCLECVKDLKEQNEQLVKDLRTARISVVSYKTGLESVEARLLVFKKNESVYEEDIKLLKREIYLRDLDIIELKRKLELAIKEKDKTARKENEAPIIEDWVSVSDEENVPKVNTVKGNKGNAVKASACWVWRPKQKKLDHVSRNNGASMSFKRFDYINAQGRSKHMTGNRSYLTDYKEKNGGFVAFGGNSKGGKITGKGGLTCLFAKATPDESNLWHRRLGHVNFKTMNKLVRGNLVRGLPSKLFEINQTCVACQKGKQHKASCKTKTVSSISQPLQMLHMDLFGLTFVKSLMKKMYCLVVTDDFSRFSWVFFLATKDETSEILKTFITGIENLIDLRVKVIRCDNGTEFKNRVMNQFCEMKGIKREFSVARTPQQNGVAKRKNRTLIEAARTMLADSKLPTTFWAEVVNTACYVQNRVLVIKPHNKTPYELFLGRKHALSFMRPFGCLVTILNTIDHLGKFDRKADEGFFVGYSTNNKAFRVFNSRTRIVEENMHTQDPPFSSSLKDSPDAGFKPLGEEEKKDAEDLGNEGGNPSKDGERVDQEKDANVNSTNNINTISLTVNAVGIEDNVVDENIVYGCVDDPNMPDLEEISR
ncbi:putative ribonuclease H-like domain-containing protein, partial [Tanacetum coccineum]